jgi:hypothetical protein
MSLKYIEFDDFDEVMSLITDTTIVALAVVARFAFKSGWSCADLT